MQPERSEAQAAPLPSPSSYSPVSIAPDFSLLPPEFCHKHGLRSLVPNLLFFLSLFGFRCALAAAVTAAAETPARLVN